MRRAAVGGLVAVAIAASLSGCSDDGPDHGEAVLTVDGEAVVIRSSGDSDPVNGRATVNAGDRVEAVSGSFLLELPGGAHLEGRATDGGRDPTRILVGDVPDLEAGEVLVVAGSGAEVSSAGTTFVLEPTVGRESAARVSRSLAVAATTYAGVVTLDSAGQRRTVRALRSMEVSALGRPPADARPLVYTEADPWDRRYLAEAMEFGRQLEAMARAYTGSLGPDEGRTPGFYRLVLPALEDEASFGEALINPSRAPGETLVGAAISVLGRTGTFLERWQGVFAFRDAGAAWGLVALDQSVDGEPLLGTVEDALNATTFEFAAPPAAPPAAPTTTTTGTTAAPPTTVTATTGSTVPPAPTTTEPPPSGGGQLVPDTGVPLIDQLIEPVENLLVGMLGG